MARPESDVNQIERPVTHENATSAAHADWFAPPVQQPGVNQYADLLLARWRWIVLAVLLALLAAGVYLAKTPDTYKATADVLVTPIPRGSSSYVGLGLPMESDDPTRDVETASRLIETPAVAARVKSQLGLAASPNALLGDVSAAPVAQASLVAITATASSPRRAAQIANAFARVTIALRTQRLNAQLDVLIPELRAEVKAVSATEQAFDPLTARLRDLQGLRLTGDPTLRLETAAVPPTAAAGPRTILTLAAAFLGSLILAVCVIIALQAFDTRLRSEEELRRYRLPILARIPIERTALTGGALSPTAMPIGMRDSYRLLATSLRALHGDSSGGRILVTGPTPADGKSTTALCLASALAVLTEDVVLVELDTRSPSLAGMLDVTPQFDLADVAQRRVPLSKALITAKGEHAGRLRALLVRREPSDWGLAPPPGATAEVLDQAEGLGGWLLVDAPALNYVADALPVAKRVDSVIIVVRIGNTRVRDLDALAELFAQHGITPGGFVLVGAKTTPYYGMTNLTPPPAWAASLAPKPAAAPAPTRAESEPAESAPLASSPAAVPAATTAPKTKPSAPKPRQQRRRP
jgi:receptor protein-tyrosine kinase